MDKKILRRLMLLRNETANKKLSEIADQIIEDVKTSSDNDKTLEKLNLLEEFVYAVPDQALEVANFIFNNKKPNKPNEKSSKYLIGLIGSSHDRLIIKALEVLDKVRYLRTKEVLEMVVNLDSKDNEVLKKREEILNHIVRYDYHVLKQIGLAVQKVVLEFIEKNLNNLELKDLLLFSKQLLASDFEGSELIEEDKISFITGALPADGHTKEVRLKTLEVLFGKLTEVKDVEQKLSILQVIEGAIRFPIRKHKDDFEKMVDENARFIINKYEKNVLKGGKVIEDFRVVSEVIEQLAWIKKRLTKEKSTQKVANELITKINDNSDYSLYSDLVEDNSIFRTNLDEKRKKLKEKSNEFFNSIDEKNWEEKIDKLNMLATFYDPNGNTWKWRNFSNLIIRIGTEKSDIANKMLDKIVKNDLQMKKFVAELLAGLRTSKDFNLLNKYITTVLKTGDTILAGSILNSMLLVVSDKLQEQITDNDLELLQKLSNNDRVDLMTRNLIFIVCVSIYKRSPNMLKPIIIKNLKETNEVERYLSIIHTALIRDQFDFKDWAKADLELITGRLVELKRFEYDEMEIITEIAKLNMGVVLDLFEARMKYKAKKNDSQELWDTYDAIPYDFDEELTEMLQESKEYEERLGKWVQEMESNVALSDWLVAEFVSKIGGRPLSNILSQLIESGRIQNLNKAINLQDGLYESDVDLIIRVIEKTDNERIHKRALGRLYTTNFVTGEYGIRDFFLERVEELKKIKEDNKNKNVQKFTELAIKSFNEAAASEEKRVKEELIRRKIEFES